MNGPSASSGQPAILTLNIKDKAALYSGYMPFIKNGGLFIPTTKEYRLGDEVFILLTLMEDPERLPVAGKIIWITPKGAQNKRPQGIGVQFSEQDGGVTQKKIEALLAGALGGERPTHTM
ncbi:PilZ domain-containing protein [Sinimarinibacterium sp. NLF-5-8]|uniref:PilZ domain-containing protein n=1 Tax=Sinimarinibacterium sp. NLF-5-8 TaxID=2698684 RepID=UPI00137C1B04|nr:PilZ domain-containing protein [Sinimarinibacterium sp. NLF-5-8]QHS09492.1 pilus assembly protein PilZ [Sinimarinibacterium sp. NLF-5-8]